MVGAEVKAGGEAVEHRAPGVAYAESPAAPGLALFRCEALDATLSTRGCAGRWTAAQPGKTRSRRHRVDGDRRPPAEALEVCRGCAIGAHHAGRAPIRYSPWYAAEICPRCHKGTTRMIHNRRCVSCYNRERELRAGRNARGHEPVRLMLRAPAPHSLKVIVDGRPASVRMVAADPVEVRFQVLRTTKGQVDFATAAAPDLRQGRLL